MKKILRFGIITALAALISTGIVFAGNGNDHDKDKKTKIALKSSNVDFSEVSINVYCSEFEADEIDIITRDGDVLVKELYSIEGGFCIIFSYDPGDSFVGDDDIIFEIVGVDNITGVYDNEDEASTPMNIMVNNDNNGDNNSGDDNHIASSGDKGDNGDGFTPPVTPNVGKFDITVYPNPITTQTNVVTVGEILGRTINVMDLSGKSIMTINISGKNRAVLDLSGLQPGIYILNFTAEDGRVISKRIQKI